MLSLFWVPFFHHKKVNESSDIVAKNEELTCYSMFQTFLLYTKCIMITEEVPRQKKVPSHQIATKVKVKLVNQLLW